MDLTGEQLGNYRLIKNIGNGGFADVYQGEHKHLRRLAAVKVLRAQLTAKEEQEFLEEARRLASLGHPHIVPVYDFDVVGGVPFLAMAYADNGTLRDRFPFDPLAPGSSIAPYIKQVAEALQFVHDNKLVHRDIKPENILLGSGDTVWLADFGIAVEAQLQMRQSALGTLEYMAPEQIQRKATAASDQYSLAVIVYEWFCGLQPFTGDTRQVAFQHIHTPPPPLSTKVPTISPLIENVILKALAKDPQKRFANIRAFASALGQACQQALPTTSTVPGTTATPTKKLQPPATTIIPRAAPTALIKQLPGTCLTTYSGHKGFVQAVAWSPSDSLVASGSADQVHLWDVLTGATVFTYRDRNRRGQIWSIAWSPDGKRITCGTTRQVAYVWVATNGNLLITYDKHKESPPGLKFTVGWSGDGKYIASGGVDKTVQVWDANNATSLLTYHGHADEVTAVCWSPDSKYIASASDDKTVQVWDAITGALAFKHSGHTREVYAVAWSPDGKSIASASRDASVQVWNATTDDRLLTYTGHERRVRALAWSPDNKYIASVDDDKIVHVWDAFTGKDLFRCEGHSGLVNALSWSADGQFLASASNDNSVRIWSAFGSSLIQVHKSEQLSELAPSLSTSETNLSSQKNFFIFYHKSDQKWAEWVAWHLEEAGYSVILPNWDFRAGSNLSKEVQQAIKKSQRVIEVISPDYLSTNITNSGRSTELRDRLKRPNLILPVYVHQCNFELTQPIETIVSVELFERNESTARALLLQRVRNERSKPIVPPPFPGNTEYLLSNYTHFLRDHRDSAEAVPFPPTIKNIEIFFSYAHEDKKWRDELEKYLSHLKRQFSFTVWHDGEIEAGKEWAQEINEHLSEAYIILLLISQDFMASNYCYNIEMQRALERHEAKEACVIPVILRPALWKNTPIGKLQALPTNTKPITTWENHDEAYLDVAKGIQKAIDRLTRNI